MRIVVVLLGTIVFSVHSIFSVTPISGIDRMSGHGELRNNIEIRVGKGAYSNR